MTEIRTIRADEAEGFLRLLCGVFDLDYQRAHSVFFSEPLFDLDRKWALFEDGVITSILTTTGLEFGWGRAIGIAGVATRPERRSLGYATRLLEHVMGVASQRGETGALLFAREPSLYEKLGFKVVDLVVRGHLGAQEDEGIPDSLTYHDVRAIYTRWAEADAARLRRDEKRWNYWKWHYRVCSPYGSGYLCVEGSVLREAILDAPSHNLPLPAGAEWFGLATMAKRLGITLTDSKFELYLMGRSIPMQPQMFMTDQF